MTLTPHAVNPATNGHGSVLATDTDHALRLLTNPNPDLYLEEEPVTRAQKTDPELGLRVAQFLLERGWLRPRWKRAWTTPKNAA